MITVPGAKVLVVEDDEDSRELLLAFLGAEGYDVLGAESAEDALALLAARGFAMLITDFRLPGQDGSWLLREAEKRGLLARVGALICSGEIEANRLDGARVLKKPVNLDRLLLEIEAAMTTARRDGFEEQPAALSPFSRGIQSERTPLLELVLYISDSMTSVRAIRNLQRALDKYPVEQTNVLIIDLIKDPLAGTLDRVAFTPMLVRRFPPPRESMLGDLRSADALHELFEPAGLERKS